MRFRSLSFQTGSRRSACRRQPITTCGRHLRASLTSSGRPSRTTTSAAFRMRRWQPSWAAQRMPRAAQLAALDGLDAVRPDELILQIRRALVEAQTEWPVRLEGGAQPGVAAVHRHRLDLALPRGVLDRDDAVETDLDHRRHRLGHPVPVDVAQPVTQRRHDLGERQADGRAGGGSLHVQ